MVVTAKHPVDAIPLMTTESVLAAGGQESHGSQLPLHPQHVEYWSGWINCAVLIRKVHSR